MTNFSIPAIGRNFEVSKTVPSGRQKWVVVALLFMVGVINYADRTSITALYTLLKSDLGFNDVGIGAIGSFFLWSYAIASPFAGHVGDRTNRSFAVTWSLAGWSVVTILTGLVATRGQLLAMRALLGLIESLYLPAALALVAEYHDFKTRAKAQSLLSVGQYLGMVVGGTLAGYLGERQGWRAPLYVLGIAGLLLAFVCWVFLPRGNGDSSKAGSDREQEHGQSFVAGVRALIRIPSFSVLALGGVLTAIGAWIFINWLPLYFRETFGTSLAQAGFLGSSLVSISAAVSQLFGGAVSDAIAKKGVHRRLWMNAILILAAAPTLLTFVVTRNRTAIMVALVLYSAFRNAGDLNLIPLLCDVAGKGRMSIAIGMTNMLNTLVGGAGILVAGFLKSDFGLTSVFTGIAVILLLDAAILFLGCVFFIRRDLQPMFSEPSLTTHTQ